ncbi:MAG: GNAT family N-acetyltransferase [Acidimicrobiales bacterium]|nr:MAG: GNAT family N-acetyltransferase [Acidimicrobiales bacterium]
MKGAVIRRVTPAEWESLRTVRLAALQEAPFAFGSTYEREYAFTEAKWHSRLGTSAWFIAWLNDQPVGLAASRTCQGTSATKRELLSMWVHPAQRGTGMAVELVAAVKAWAVEEGAEVLTLYVVEGNNRGRQFYSKLGFTSTGRWEPLASNPEVNTEELSCLLAPKPIEMG